MRLARRALLRYAGVAAAGSAAGAAMVWTRGLLPDGLPVTGGYASAADRSSWERLGQVTVTWYAPTATRLIALTFDDGPAPRYTPMVLDALDAAGVPATFFMVGRNLAAHAALVRGRLDRHAVGNHTWSHRDLAQTDADAARAEVLRGHEAIHRYLDREPTLLRPPYGHLGGAALLAASDLRYQVVLWSLEMREDTYRHDPAGQVRYIAGAARPGGIVLAHDAGPAKRLVTLRHLGEMIRGLRERGFRFVTVPDLLATTAPAAGPSSSPLPSSPSSPLSRAAPADPADPAGARADRRPGRPTQPATAPVG